MCSDIGEEGSGKSHSSKSHHGLWLREAGVHIYILAAELYEKLLAQVH